MHRYTIHYLATSSDPPPDDESVFSQGLLEKLGLSKKLGGDDPPGRAIAKDEADSDRKPYNLDLDVNEP